MDPFLTRLLIAVLVYFFFNIVIEKLVTEAKAKSIFEVVLLIACILYLLFGSFLPALPVR
jgi:hypothetical protein